MSSQHSSLLVARAAATFALSHILQQQWNRGAVASFHTTQERRRWCLPLSIRGVVGSAFSGTLPSNAGGNVAEVGVASAPNGNVSISFPSLLASAYSPQPASPTPLAHREVLEFLQRNGRRRRQIVSDFLDHPSEFFPDGRWFHKLALWNHRFRFRLVVLISKEQVTVKD